jgi:hypothetical protein
MRDALRRRISDATDCIRKSAEHQEFGRTSNEQLARSSQPSGSGGIFEN